ncbi:MAG: hypothetical protein A2287_07320 [Candidatus Melainabacteria bacterium RIFOXYA12_FULL_32_12]|nr:MAG: hypothetical protein A2104_02865 [Candidatus Melainabacteria bacterium GWF2_32_7]OGI30397.1 MAG: hypothetical protein A2287_07320 [Candidatus Melainabacteria bacterium RIFOXYA12_FULL_32_12]
MFSPELMNYILDPKSPKNNAKQVRFYPSCDNSSIKDIDKIKSTATLFKKIISFFQKEFNKKLRKCK